MKNRIELANNKLKEALFFHQNGQIIRAIGLYEEIIKISPKNYDAFHLAGLAYTSVHKIDVAIKYLSKSLEINPKFYPAYQSLGNAYFMANKLEKSLECYNKFIPSQPKLPDAHYNKGLLLFNLGRIDEAIASYKQAIELKADYTDAINNTGLALGALNRFSEALDYFNRALTLHPSNLDVILNRGITYNDMGDYQAALADFNRIIMLKKDVPEAYLGRGIALLKQERWEEASADFDAALKIRPDFSEAYSNLGLVYKKLGLNNKAIEHYQAAIVNDPKKSDYYYNLGNLLKVMNRLEEALQVFDQALALHPAFADAHHNRGDVLLELNRLDEAVASYTQAIAIRPDFAAAWASLAKIDSENGNFEEAGRKYQKALSLDPVEVTALCGMAEIEKIKDGDPLIKTIADLLLSEAVSDGSRALLHHAYAKMCNDLKQYDDAMTHFSTSKSLLRSTFDGQHHSEKYVAMMSAFKPEFFAERKGFGLADERPVFVVGMPRSGTSLTEQILASHGQIDGLGELQDLPRIVREMVGDLGKPVPFYHALAQLQASDVKAMAERYCEAYGRSSRENVRIIDKRPHNFELLGIIALMFPKAHIIHCRRDALDNCVSMYMQSFNENHGYNQDLTTLGHYYTDYDRLMYHWAKTLPLPMYECSYEETVSDVETSARALVSFLGLEWDANCLNYNKNDRQVRTPSQWQVRQPIYQTSVERWRRYDRYLDPLKKALGMDGSSDQSRLK